MNARTFAVLGLLPATLLACTSVRHTDPPTTATQQFLTSVAAQQTVDALPQLPLENVRVFVDETYTSNIEPVGRTFLIAEIRARLLISGARLVRQREQAGLIVEVRSGALSIDRSSMLVGVPSSAVTAGLIALGLPYIPPTEHEIALVRNDRRFGMGDVAVVAYRPDGGQIVGAWGPATGRGVRDQWKFFLLGSRMNSNIPTTDPPRQ